jgi:hypothetical protein
MRKRLSIKLIDPWTSHSPVRIQSIVFPGERFQLEQYLDRVVWKVCQIARSCCTKIGYLDTVRSGVRVSSCLRSHKLSRTTLPQLGISPKHQRLRAANPRHPAICGVAPTAQEAEPDQLQSLAEGEFMANLIGLASFVSELRAERTNLASQLKHVDAALSVLGKLNGGSSYAKPRRTLSASVRKRMSLAQKARWSKRTNIQARTARPKRTISAAGKKRIAAAQRARWAKVRAAKK